MARDKHLLEFGGMQNVKGNLRGPQVGSVSAMLVMIRRHRVVASAGDHGSISVYIDDAGQLRAEFMRWRSTVEAALFQKKSELKPWLEKWWPKMREAQP